MLLGRLVLYIVAADLLLLLGACDFGGDRSLGVVATTSPDNAAGAGMAVPATFSGGAGGVASFTINVAGATGIALSRPGPTCNPHAEPPECGAGSFCALDPQCGLGPNPVPATCQKTPTECATPNGFETICGCDQKFYESRCLAARASVSEADLSFCEAIACRSNADCARVAEGCADSYGQSVKGAVCDNSACVCGGTLTIL